MLHEELVKYNKAEFVAKVKSISDTLGIDPNWLMHVMYRESTLNPQAVNKNGGATGLIQFMPDTAKSLGTTTAALYKMNNVQQLDYVYKYLASFKRKFTSYIDLYMTVFFPAAIGKPKSWIMQAKNLPASVVRDANAALDLNKDGMLTIAEVETVMLSKVPKSLLESFMSFKKKTVSQ